MPRYAGVFKRCGHGASCKCPAPWAYRAQYSAGGERSGVSGSGYVTAKEANNARYSAIAAGKRQSGPSSTVTLAEYLAAWHEGHARTIRPGSSSTYKARVSAISDHPLASKRLTSLTERDYRRMIGDWRDELAHSTLLGRVGTLQTALNAAVRSGILSSDPLAGIKISRTKARFIATTWDLETALAFLRHRREAQDPLYLAWHLALVTGLRRGELHGLKREDLDLEHGRLWVRRQRSAIRGIVHEGPPKTEGSDAPVYLDSATCALLAACDWTVSDYVVTDPRTGRPYHSLDRFLAAWHRATDEAGAPRIRFHDLRHTSASLLAAAGVPLSAAQQRLRHWSPRMTAAYTQVNDDTAAQVAARIGAVLQEPVA